ncbi:RNA polymerase sigma factor [Pseudopedobacter beijingensis]|uniref:RNA polymerase sigma factor n=1 Tax=Pseudopedobacter beijingensis TaxID=1207056 RepID=A0ABW4ICL1_9SPHI
MFSDKSDKASLLKNFRDGDEKAFRVFYDQYHRKVYRFAYSFLKEKEQSQEVLQETFINLWVNREKIDINKPIEPYLFVICKRLVLDAFRKATSTDALREGLMRKISGVDNGTEEKIIYTDIMHYAETAISKLPKQQQLVFRLSRFEGLSFDEIAERLSLSRNTVKNHLVVALKTLRTQLENQQVLYVFILFLMS